MAPSALPAAVFGSCGGRIWEQWWRDWVTTTETGLGNCGRRRDLGAAAVLRQLESGGGHRMGMGRGLVKWQLVQYSTSMTKRFGHGTCKFGRGTRFYDQLMTKLNWSQKLRHIWSTMTNRSFWS
jgi:hypothetical protein